MVIYAFIGVISLPAIVGGACVYKYYRYRSANGGYIPENTNAMDILFS